MREPARPYVNASPSPYVTLPSHQFFATTRLLSDASPSS